MCAQLEFPFGHETRDPRWLTIAEAAERVRCCERTIRRAIDSGALRAGRVRGARGSRGAVRIRPEDIASWLFEEDDVQHGADARTGTHCDHLEVMRIDVSPARFAAVDR